MLRRKHCVSRRSPPIVTFVTGVPSFPCGDHVEYHHDADTVLSATVLGVFDDGYLIRLDPDGLSPEVAARVLGVVNAHFVEHHEHLLTPNDPLFVSGERARSTGPRGYPASNAAAAQTTAASHPFY
jgi:hypothetical protein